MISILIFSLLISLNSYSNEFLELKVLRIMDGDTFRGESQDGKNFRVRLYGIDAPEKNQEFGQKSKSFLVSKITDHIVNVEVIDTDRYGRKVGLIKLKKNHPTINYQVVFEGLAWVYQEYCKKDFCRDWLRLEEKNKKEGRGLFKNPNPKPPWDFRHQK